MIYWLKLISSHKHIKKKEKRKDTRRIRLDPVTGFSQFESPLQQMSVSLLPAPGIAWLCCDARRQVRMQALTYLQRALLVHDLQTLDATEWESCFNKVRKEEKGHMSLLTIKSFICSCTLTEKSWYSMLNGHRLSWNLLQSLFWLCSLTVSELWLHLCSF